MRERTYSSGCRSLVQKAFDHAIEFHDINLEEYYSREQFREIVQAEYDMFWAQFEHLLPDETLAGPFDGLCDREREIAEYVAHGFSNKEIANKLFISERTVSTHLDHIYAKLNVHSRVALVAMARASDRMIETAIRKISDSSYELFTLGFRKGNNT